MSEEPLTPAQQRAREAWLRDIAEADGIDAAVAMRRKRQVHLERDGVSLRLFYDGETFVRAHVWIRGGPSAGRFYRSERAAREVFETAAPDPPPTGSSSI